MAAPRFLHVANGYSTTRLIHQAGIPGTCSIWADPLHEGPVPDGLSDDELLDVRARHLARRPERVAATIAELRHWRAVIDEHDSYDELVLWYEHDLFDQLNLIQVLSRIARTVPSTASVSLICLGSFPGRAAFKGLGELTPLELAPLFDTRQRVSHVHTLIAERAWVAFRSPDPRRLEDVLLTDTSALPFLAAALQRHLEEFPSTRNGLARTEEQVMSLAQAGPIDVWTAFARLHDLETAFFIADASFRHLVQGLAFTSPSLVTLDVQFDTSDQLPHGMIWLTDTGQDVLRGETDRVRRCGVERWLGGVHLKVSEMMWRWDAGERHIVREDARLDPGDAGHIA